MLNVLLKPSKQTLTLTLSHPMGEGTAIDHRDLMEMRLTNHAVRQFEQRVNNSPSPIGWERAGVRVLCHPLEGFNKAC